MFSRFLLILLLFLALDQSASYALTSLNQDIIRVGIASNGLTQYAHNRITVAGKLTVTNGVRPVWSGDGPILVYWRDGWWISRDDKPLLKCPDRLLTIRSDQGLITLPSLKRPGGMPRYRGSIQLQPADKTGFYVVNILPMQDYLKAVVPNELPARFGMEAVKAQSVAARNYALRPREVFWKAFDICDSQYCQAYYGAQTETEATNRAVEETEGLVLLHNHQYALTVFSSTAGGLTEAYAHVFSDPLTRQFPAPAIPYLSPLADPQAQLSPNWDFSSEVAARNFWARSDVPSYDSASPYYRWTRQWTGQALQQDVCNGLMKVSRDGATKAFVYPLLKRREDFGQLTGLRVLSRGRTGKAMQLQVITTRGVWTVEKEFLIRSVLNQNGKLLPSGNVVLTERRTSSGGLIGLTAYGGGLGHGVGMSQFGASGMARHGYTFDQILMHYYPGTVLGTRPIQGDDTLPKRLTFRLPPHPSDHVSLWVQGGQPAIQLNDQVIAVRPSEGLQCHSLSSARLKLSVDNELVVTGPGKVWLEMAACP